MASPTRSEHRADRRPRWPWLVGFLALGGVGILALIIVVVLAVAFGLFYLTLVFTAPVSHGPAFARALADDDTTFAYGLLCERTKETMSYEEFVAEIAPNEQVVILDLETSGGGRFDPPPRTVVRFELGDGTVVERTYDAEPPIGVADGNLFVCDPPPFD